MNFDRHLDLGCGLNPRNPYRASESYGCDIRNFDLAVDKEFTYRQANLVEDPIPFEDDFFYSVSAFDFIEHIPRQAFVKSKGHCNPFIDLMNEIYRVLKPGGIFVAFTPAYPSPEAFVDPTHVNIITDRTHLYFCSPNPPASIYGFKGCFEPINVRREARGNVSNALQSDARKFFRRLHRRLIGEHFSHILWELKKCDGKLI